MDLKPNTNLSGTLFVLILSLCCGFKMPSRAANLPTICDSEPTVSPIQNILIGSGNT